MVCQELFCDCPEFIGGRLLHNEVNSPKHYTGVQINGVDVECIDVVEALGLGFCIGNALKYVWRAGKKSKSPITDLKKAVWYLNRAIDHLVKGDDK